MARVSSKFTCTACDNKVSREETACSRCGHPTDHATMEQRVVWELGRWQQSREAPVVARDTSDARTSVRPAAVTQPPPLASAPAAPAASASPVVSTPRTSGATAPAYDFDRDVESEPVRPDPPQLVRRLPVEHRETASHVPAITDGPAAEPQSRRLAPLSVAQPEAATETAEVAEKESRRSRKARDRADEKQRAEDEKQRAEDQKRAEAAERVAAKQRAVQEREEQRRAEAEQPSRSDRRKARKYKRLTDGITLHEGETITLTMGGWSRWRPAVLVVTRYRVALITKLPHSVHWIPLEEVSKMSLHWRGGWTLEIEGSVEFLSLHKRRKQTLISVKELLASEVAESRAPGGRRHHPEVTQDWCDRSIEMWETHAGQIRLFIRRHPLLVVATLAIWVPVAYYFALR